MRETKMEWYDAAWLRAMIVSPSRDVFVKGSPSDRLSLARSERFWLISTGSTSLRDWLDKELTIPSCATPILVRFVSNFTNLAALSNASREMRTFSSPIDPFGLGTALDSGKFDLIDPDRHRWASLLRFPAAMLRVSEPVPLDMQLRWRMEKTDTLIESFGIGLGIRSGDKNVHDFACLYLVPAHGLLSIYYYKRKLHAADVPIRDSVLVLSEFFDRMNTKNPDRARQREALVREAGHWVKDALKSFSRFLPREGDRERMELWLSRLIVPLPPDVCRSLPTRSK
jgi:hypothetical protein